METAQLNEIFLGIAQATNAGIDALLPALNGLLVALAVISIAVTFALGAVREDLSPLPTLITKLLYIGAILFLIENWGTLRNVLIDGAVQVGLLASGNAGGQGQVLDPAQVIIKGAEIFVALFGQIGELTGPVSFFANFDDILLLATAAFIILAAFLILAITIFVALVEFYIGTTAALVLLPFAVYRPVSFAAQSALGYVMASGIKIIVLTMIVGLGTTLFLEPLPDPAATPIGEGDALGIAFAALALGIVSWSASSLASGLVQGGPALGAATVAGPAATAVATLVPTSQALGRGISAGASALGGLRGGAIGRLGGSCAGSGGGSSPALGGSGSAGQLSGPSRGQLGGSAHGGALPSPPSGLLPGPGGGAGSAASANHHQLPATSGQGTLSTGGFAGGGGGSGAGGATDGGGRHGGDISASIGRRRTPPAGEQSGKSGSGSSRFWPTTGLAAAHAVASDRPIGGLRGPDLERE